MEEDSLQGCLHCQSCKMDFFFSFEKCGNSGWMESHEPQILWLVVLSTYQSIALNEVENILLMTFSSVG